MTELEETQEEFEARMDILRAEIKEGEEQLKVIKAELWSDGFRLVAHLGVLLGLLLALAGLFGSQLAMGLTFCVAAMWVAQYGIMVIKRRLRNRCD